MKYVTYISVVLYIVFLITLIRLLFKKGEIHFMLLKELFPRAFKGIDSFYNPMLYFSLFNLNIKDIFWFILPIYYQRKTFLNDKSEKAKLHHKNLLKNNRKILILFIGIIILVFLPVFVDFLLN